ncbi:hypothetical protein [Serpentinicella alkaliphila]|uniref:DUF8042 domain-containing protein n=1 Tax=Serpentinicella alkaliphila TaxID=1734049 RepID=A0A4R2TK26_9FIRM|nr:hypothetical protein [Serpentinicella alkaliphila]TCQ02722.1 hypothetical protein EDD79_10132 [Serpentinicella alkaliphila]
MNKHIEVIYNILPLLFTIEEGLIHVKQQISELRYEEALGLLQDSMLGIASIEQSIAPMKEKVPMGNISLLTSELKNNIINVLVNYEKGRQEFIEGQIEVQVLLSFMSWKEEIEKILKPYILS